MPWLPATVSREEAPPKVAKVEETVKPIEIFDHELILESATVAAPPTKNLIHPVSTAPAQFAREPAGATPKP